MAKNFIESYDAGAIKLPSDRSTGLVFVAVAVIVAVLWRNSPTVPWVALTLAALLAITSFGAPSLLRPLNILWFRFGLLLHRVVNPLVMLAMFALVFVPAGLLMRLFRDPLRARRARQAATYWIERSTGDGPKASMTNQF